MKAAALGLAAGALLLALASLSWRFQHDAPILLYVAALIDQRGFLPYRDLFEMNMPGAYLAYLLAGRVSGYSDLGLRLVDLALLLEGAAFSAAWLRPRGRWAALAGASLLPLLYLSLGVDASLQRESFVLALVIPAAFLTLLRPRISWRWRGLALALCGVLFGLAALVKPQAALGLSVVGLDLLFSLTRPALTADQSTRRARALGFVGAAALLGLGFALPLAAAWLWLVQSGAWEAFLDLALHYWPLYTQLSESLTILSPAERPLYLLLHFFEFGWLGLFPLPAWWNWAQAGAWRAERRVQLLAGFAAAYALYALSGGQFWAYHWLPCAAFTLLLCAWGLGQPPGPRLCEVRGERGREVGAVLPFCCLEKGFSFVKTTPGALPALLLLGALFFSRVNPLMILLAGAPQPDPLHPKHGRVDEMSQFLQTRLQPGDRVQPLDWTGGAVHAMLLARALPATPFLYDFYFYHHVSQPYIQSLRSRLLYELNLAPPRYVIQVSGSEGDDKPWPQGLDTTRRFLALEEFLALDYAPVQTGAGYVIYERQR